MDIVEQIKKIKELRLKPIEKYLIEKYYNLQELYIDIYPNSVFYTMDDIIIFEQDNNSNIFYMDYGIMTILNIKFDFDYECNDDVNIIKWFMLTYKTSNIDRLAIYRPSFGRWYRKIKPI